MRYFSTHLYHSYGVLLKSIPHSYTSKGPKDTFFIITISSFSLGTTIYEKILDGLNSMLSESFERVDEVYGDRKKHSYTSKGPKDTFFIITISSFSLGTKLGFV